MEGQLGQHKTDGVCSVNARNHSQHATSSHHQQQNKSDRTASKSAVRSAHIRPTPPGWPHSAATSIGPQHTRIIIIVTSIISFNNLCALRSRALCISVVRERLVVANRFRAYAVLVHCAFTADDLPAYLCSYSVDMLHICLNVRA